MDNVALNYFVQNTYNILYIITSASDEIKISIPPHPPVRLQVVLPGGGFLAAAGQIFHFRSIPSI